MRVAEGLEECVERVGRVLEPRMDVRYRGERAQAGVMEDGDAVGERLGDFRELGRVEDGLAPCCRASDLLAQERIAERVHARRERLIQQPEVGVRQRQRGERGLVLLAARELSDARIDVGEHIELAQDGDGAFGRIGRVGGVDAGDGREVLDDRSVVEQRGGVGDVEDAAAQRDVGAFQRLGVAEDCPRLRDQHGGEATQERCLARAVQPDDRHQLPRLDSQRHLVQRLFLCRAVTV